MLFNKLKNYSTKPHSKSLPGARHNAADHSISIQQTKRGSGRVHATRAEGKRWLNLSVVALVESSPSRYSTTADHAQLTVALYFSLIASEAINAKYNAATGNGMMVFLTEALNVLDSLLYYRYVKVTQ